MSLAFESPTRGNGTSEAYFTPLNMPPIITNSEDASNNSTVNTPYYTAPINPSIHQDFLNAIQARHATQPTVLTSPTPERMPAMNLSMGSLASRRQSMAAKEIIPSIDATKLNQLLQHQEELLLVLDVRSFVQYSHSRIRGSINISIPNTILKRPTFTLDKVYEAIVQDQAREKLKSWEQAKSIVFYDQSSMCLQENSASAYLATKLMRAGFKGQLLYLKGGFDVFFASFKSNCESTAAQISNQNLGPPTIAGESFCLKLPGTNNSSSASTRPKLRLSNMPVAAPMLGPFTAPMPQFENQAFNPFFSNIRQNMELSHGPIRERFPIRLPPKCNPDQLLGNCKQKAPHWLQSTVNEQGAKLLAETYEKLERTEQRRLQNIMHFHSKHTSNPSEYPFSIVAGIEMGALNRYTNIWPFEYTRVKIRNHKVSDYINASYVQYIDSEESVSDARPDQVNTQCVKLMKECATKNTQPYRRYISTQGPLPATFNDFWQVVWEENSRVLVMLTKEEEMNKIKCHRYWPSAVNAPTKYGDITITLTSTTTSSVKKINQGEPVNEDDVVITRQLLLKRGDDDEVRQVTHLQYTGWMDFGVPDNPLGTLKIIQMADQTQRQYQPTAGPMIVHCSAGCGRSGAFCAIDTVLYRLNNEPQRAETKDILLETISRFREQRLSMVQTLRQFVFCYEAICWWFLGYNGLDTTATTSTTNTTTSQVDSMDTTL